MSNFSHWTINELKQATSRGWRALLQWAGNLINEMFYSVAKSTVTVDKLVMCPSDISKSGLVSTLSAKSLNQ